MPPASSAAITSFGERTRTRTATRALADGASKETAVCALLHDVGELLAPACHGEVGELTSQSLGNNYREIIHNLRLAGSLLRPYISEENHWILIHHEIFQAYYYGDAMNVDKDLRDRFKDSKHFKACEEVALRLP